MAEIQGGKPHLKVDAIYAYLAQGEDGCEGVMAAQVPINGRMTMMPLIGADLTRLKSLLPVANTIALESNMTFRIYKFDNKTDITDEIELG